jgi:hypothetical protein
VPRGHKRSLGMIGLVLLSVGVVGALIAVGTNESSQDQDEESPLFGVRISQAIEQGDLRVCGITAQTSTAVSNAGGRPVYENNDPSAVVDSEGAPFSYTLFSTCFTCITLCPTSCTDTCYALTCGSTCLTCSTCDTCWNTCESTCLSCAPRARCPLGSVGNNGDVGLTAETGQLRG